MRVTRGVSGFRGRLVLTACLLLGAQGSAGAQVPLPPPADRVVHDFAGVLSAQAVQTMERFHKELFDQTQVAIVVVTIPNLEGEPIRDFSVRVGTEWGVGKQDVDRGIVVALAVEERGIDIATGYGVEGFLPDGRVGGILDAAVPLFAAADFSAGLLQISAALVSAAAEEYGVTIEGTAAVLQSTRQGATRAPGPGRSLLGLLFVIGMIYLAFRHPMLFFLLLFSGMGRGMGMRGGFRGGGFGGGGGFVWLWWRRLRRGRGVERVLR